MASGKKKTWNILWTCAAILLGNGLLAFAVEAFIVPHGIIMGGTTGIAIVLERVLPLDMATIVFILNALLLVLGGVVLGKKLWPPPWPALCSTPGSWPSSTASPASPPSRTTP